MLYISQRWVVCTLCSLSLALVNYMNACFFALADIIHSVTADKLPKDIGGCPFLYSPMSWMKRDLPLTLPQAYWDPYTLSVADSSYNIGKFIVAVPAGIMSDIGYSKYVIGGGMLLLAVLQILRPVLVDAGVFVKVVIMFLQGLGEASILPSILSLISRWCPPSERNLFTAIVFAGEFYGRFLGQALFPFVYIKHSWSFGTYSTGVVILVWSVFCFIFVYHSPEESRFVSEHEFRATGNPPRRSVVTVVQHLGGIPWRRMIISRPFLSLILMFACLDWATRFNFRKAIKYYQLFVLHLPQGFSNTSTVMLISCIPSMVMGGFIADWIIKHGVLSKLAVKRGFTFTSVIISLVFMTSACFVGCHVMAFWVLSILALYSVGVAIPIVFSAPVDLSPRDAGLLMGIMEAVRAVLSSFNHKLNDTLVLNPFSAAHWKFRSVICAMLTVALMVPFLVFGSVKRQRWRRGSASPRTSSIQQQRRRTELQTSD